MKRIIFTVTNDLVHDQRMHRICSSLAQAGYQVTLIGRKLKTSLPLHRRPYHQKRIRCFNEAGKLFYAEYNTKLFFYLLKQKADLICAIDLDTILPCLQASKIKKWKRVYDAHELFTELKEVITRPAIHKAWMGIEKRTVPQFQFGYTVSESIASEFNKRYGVNYEVIRNVPFKRMLPVVARQNFILYTGAVNEGRGLEQLIPAMKDVPAQLIICGDGNFMSKLKSLIEKNQLTDRIILKGMVSPQELYELSIRARVGVALAEKQGLNQYLALPNKFFDYIQAGLPQVTMNFPEYRRINDEYEVAVLVEDLETKTISSALNNLLVDDVLFNRLSQNAREAREILNWQEEEKKLLGFYQNLFEH